jgi:16S rRNA (guanine966-N2)-methyltransferase
MNKAKSPEKPAAHPKSTAGEVRIIGGQWKRTKLPVANKPGLRPTPDRVRETLFNWLGQDLSGWRCLDAFAGTGALGFEAASRGAKEVTLVETDGALVAQLKATQIKLQASMTQIVRGDGVASIARMGADTLDLILIDPPFTADVYPAALRAAAVAVTREGFIYLEAPVAWTDATLAPLGLQLHRYLKAGAVHAHLLTRTA